MRRNIQRSALQLITSRFLRLCISTCLSVCLVTCHHSNSDSCRKQELGLPTLYIYSFKNLKLTRMHSFTIMYTPSWLTPNNHCVTWPYCVFLKATSEMTFDPASFFTILGIVFTTNPCTLYKAKHCGSETVYSQIITVSKYYDQLVAVSVSS